MSFNAKIKAGVCEAIMLSQFNGYSLSCLKKAVNIEVNSVLMIIV